ncbi:MAG: hypothetical protein IKP40_10645 [Clostridia bacterium]|nr:hypothetical protein [Clostridia bacterium]
MKKSAIWIMILALVLLGSHALAVDYSERACYSIYVMRRDSTLYSYTEGDGSNGLRFEYTAIGTLPAGTPVSSKGTQEGEYQQIRYIDGDDHWASAAVEKGSVGDAFTILDVGIGYRVKIPTAAIRAGAQMVFDYVSWRYGVDPNMADVRRGMRGGSASAPTPSPEPITDSFYSVAREGGGTELVELVNLGTASSLIFSQRGEQEIPTADLIWESNAPAGQRVAWIVSNTGKANMRRQAGSEGRVIKQCAAGLMVAVTDLGEKYTGIICEGVQGYVLTAALGFPENESLAAVAVTAFHGTTADTKHKINLRAKASSASRRLAQFGCGEQAEVLSTDEEWAEVVLLGWHGYIQNDFLEMHLPPIDVSVTPEEPADPALNEKLWTYLEQVWLPDYQEEPKPQWSREDISAFIRGMMRAGFTFPEAFLNTMYGRGSAESRSDVYVLLQTCYAQLGDYLQFTVKDQYRLYQLMRDAGVAAYQDESAQHPALPPEGSPSQADVLASCRSELMSRFRLTEEQLDRMHVLIRCLTDTDTAGVLWQLDWMDAEGSTAYKTRYRCVQRAGSKEWTVQEMGNE